MVVCHIYDMVIVVQLMEDEGSFKMGLQSEDNAQFRNIKIAETGRHG